MDITFEKLITVAKVVGVVSSGLFSGFCWSHSFSTASINLLAADEITMIKQWTLYYLQGASVAIPCTIVNILSWGFLSYSAGQSLQRQLFFTAAVTTGSGTVFAWTALRQLNGALAIRSEKILGPYTGKFNTPMTYSRNEARSQQAEKRFSTRDLVAKWKDYNYYRSAILITGTVIGALGIAMNEM